MDFSSKCKTKTFLIWVNYVWLHSLPQSMEYKDFLHVFYVSSVIIIFWSGTKHYKNSFCIAPNIFFSILFGIWGLHTILCAVIAGIFFYLPSQSLFPTTNSCEKYFPASTKTHRPASLNGVPCFYVMSITLQSHHSKQNMYC